MNDSSAKIIINPEIKDVILAGCLQFSGLNCGEKNDALWNEMNLLAEKYKSQYDSPSEALDKLKPARELYYAIGMEPTRIRPSSEALFRRVVKGKSLYQINSIVDVCNYCSLAFLLPIGLYDLDKIQGDIEFRLGKAGEEYEGIGKAEVHVGGRLTLSDDIGVFGNPSSDSLRTSIDLNSRNVLMVIFSKSTYSEEKMLSNNQFAGKAMLHYHPEGRLIRNFILK